IYATHGGKVNLAGLTNLNSPRSTVITDTDGSTLQDSNLTDLSGVRITLDGTDSQVANSWTSFTNGALNLTGGPPLTLGSLRDTNGSSVVVATGASLALPAITTGDITLSNGATLTLAHGVVNMPAANAAGVTINVPQLPQGVVITLASSNSG